ncbi:unnamed protein product, partial [Phaeothamnion confervicola]
MKFEEASQLLLGNEAFRLFQLDRVVNALVKHLKAAVDDGNGKRLLDLHACEH